MTIKKGENTRLLEKLQVPRNGLLAVFDLSQGGVSYEFFQFLVLAEIERKVRGCDFVHLLFVPGKDCFSFNDTVYDPSNDLWRFQNILLPGCNLLPSCQQVSYCANREEGQKIYADAEQVLPTGESLENLPYGYSTSELAIHWAFGEDVQPIRAPKQALIRVNKWLKSRAQGKKVVTITLRQLNYDLNRNSNVAAWKEFVDQLDTDLYFPVAIPDTEAVFDSTELYETGLPIYPEISLNLFFRMAIYEVAYLNMLGNNGPTVLCKYNRFTNYLVFNEIPVGSWICPPESAGSRGFSLGSQPPFAQQYQKLIYDQEKLPVIKREFNNMVDLIEGRLTPNQYLPVIKETPLTVAKLLEDTQAYFQARDIYKRLLDDEPKSLELKLRLGCVESKLGHNEAAVELLFEVLDEQDTNWEAHAQLGEALKKLSRTEEAIQHFRKAEEHSEEIPVAYTKTVITHIWVLSNNNRLEEVVRLYDRARLIIPHSALLHRAMGEIFEDFGLDDEATACYALELELYKSLIAAKPDNLDYNLRTAELHNRFGNSQKALDILDSIDKRMMSNAHICRLYGDILKNLSRMEEAISYYRLAVRHSHNRDAQCLYKLAEILKFTGHHNEAIDNALKSQDLAPEFPGNYDILADVMFEQGRSREAREIMIKLKEQEAGLTI